nr:reverse transcriptase domain-containing protein [Tanacetum cinerariifolium]
MSTRSSARNLFPPLDNPKLTIQRRSRANPTLLNDFEMATEGNGDPPVLDLWTMKELRQPSLNGGTFMKRHPEECYDLIENMTTHHNHWDTSAQRTTVGQTQNVYATGAYQGGNSYQPQGPTIPTTSSSLPQVVECDTKVTKDTVPPTNNGSTKDVQPPVVQTKTPKSNSEPVVAPVIEPVVSPVSALKPNQKPSIPYPSRFHDQKLCDKANDQKKKFFQIFKDLDFNISFIDALILMPKLGLTIKTLLTNKDKLSELARTLLNEHCSVVLLKKLPEKLGDPVVDFDADPRAPLILRKSFLKTERALVDVLEGELTLREYSQEVLGFFEVITSGNPTPYYDLIVSTSSSTLTPFGDSDFLPEEVDAFLALEDDPTLPKVDHSYFDTEGGILLLEAFLNDDPSLPLPLKENLSVKEKSALVKVLKSHKQAIAWKLFDIKGINPKFYTRKILMEDDFEPAVQHQRRVNPKIHDVIKKKENELILTRLVTGWRVCIDYRKLNEATRKDHFSLPFMDQMLKRLAGNDYYCFLDGFSGYFQIPIDPKDQENTTFTCPYGMFSYRHIPFGLCNAPDMFQRCMMAIFHDMNKKTMEVFMDDFSVFWNSFKTCLCYLEKMLKSHKISKNEIEVDKVKVDVIAKLPHPTTVKGIRSLLGHAGFYRRFIQDFLKIARPMTRLLEKDTPFFFSKECVEAFQTLKRKLTEAPILIAPDWDLPFELMCDASDFAIGVVLGQRHEKHFRPIHYASKAITDAESHYTMTEKNGSRGSSGDVFTARKPLIFLRLAIMDPPRDTMARTIPPKKCLTPVFIGPQSTVMPTTWLNLVTIVNVRERFRNKMKCLKIPSKFARFLTFAASISWGHSLLHEGTNIYLWPSIICQNGSKRKRSPPMTPELFTNS